MVNLQFNVFAKSGCSQGEKNTARGVKPTGLVQWNFKAYYLYGAVAPKTGENFWLEFTHLDGQCFQIGSIPIVPAS